MLITQESANFKITDGNPGTHQGSGRKVKEIILMILSITWIKTWSDGARATIQNLVSVLANAPESVLHTELVRTFIDDFYDEQKKHLIVRGFIPFVIYLIGTLGFLT